MSREVQTDPVSLQPTYKMPEFFIQKVEHAEPAAPVVVGTTAPARIADPDDVLTQDLLSQSGESTSQRRDQRSRGQASQDLEQKRACGPHQRGWSRTLRVCFRTVIYGLE